MSYSIQEGIEDARRRLEAEEAIAEKYPDARLDSLPDGSRVWVSRDVVPDQFRVVIGKDQAYLCPYVIVKTLAVFMDHWKWVDASVTFMDLMKEEPELNKALLARIMKR